MKIAVLIKQVPDTWGPRKLDPTTGWLDRKASDPVLDEVSERALEVALKHQDAGGSEVVVITMGPPESTDSLRKGLAMGADSAVHIVDPQLAGADVMATARALAAVVAQGGFDLVVTGNESTDGRGGVIGAILSELLGWPHATFLNSVEISGDAVTGERATDHGTLEVRAALPAIISVTERSPEARFAGLRGVMKAKKKPLSTVSIGQLGVDGARTSTIVSSIERPPRTAGPKIVDDGTAANQLVEFLSSRHLV